MIKKGTCNNHNLELLMWVINYTLTNPSKGVLIGFRNQSFIGCFSQTNITTPNSCVFPILEYKYDK